MAVRMAVAVSETGSDEALRLRLLEGDESAFRQVVSAYHATMVRIARGYCSREGAAEEIVQETWLAVLKGLPRFEGRSSLKTWIFRILANRARTRAVRESRVLPFAALENDGDEPLMDPERFAVSGHWASPPDAWSFSPEKLVGDAQAVAVVMAAIEALPARQRLVITLRDLEGMEAEDVRNVLDVSETNQRVLLHRARSKVRAALEAHLKGSP